MQFLDLPIEILANVVQMLAYEGILSCRETCKTLQEIIDNSTAAQYAIELAASGKMDNPACTLSNLEKLKEVRGMSQRWARFNWKHHVGPIPVRNFASVYEFTGGRFFQDINASYMSLQDSPPCPISWLPFPRPGSIGVHQWGHSQFDFRPADICLDVARDLMVIIERRETLDNSKRSVSCLAHFRTISTNEPHPDAARPVIGLSATSDPHVNEHNMIVQLGGNNLALLLARREMDLDRTDKFICFDWTTGTRKANVLSKSGSRWDSFCFLAEDTVLLPDTGSGSLNVYTLTPEQEGLMHKVSLQLPETRRKHALHYMTVRCEPICRSEGSRYHSSNDPSSKQKPYMADPRAAIVIVALDYELPVDGEGLEAGGFVVSLSEPQVFAIKRRKLLDLAKKHGLAERGEDTAVCRSESVPLVPSEVWIRFTRWGLAPIPARWICYSQGSRYISMPDRPWRSSKKVALKIYDFNMMDEHKHDYLEQGVREHTPSDLVESWSEDDDEDEDEEIEFIPNENGELPTKVSTPTKWPIKSITLVYGETKVKKPGIFKQEFKTSLPYRLIETKAVFDWDSVVIDEDHVIGLKEEHPDTGVVESIDVLVF